MDETIPLFRIGTDARDVQYATESIERGSHWANGPFVTEFEDHIADYLDVDHAVVVNSGTSALVTALVAQDIGAGDEVIVPSFTFIATANAVQLAGATPVFADIERETFGLDPASVRDCLTPATAAIMPVHPYGGACRIEELAEVATDHDVALVEDAAEGLGADAGGRPLGTFGDAGVLSFCQNKVVTTGEGGAVVTDDEDIARRARLFRSHGRASKRYFDSARTGRYVQLGANLRMADVVAAIGCAQMERIEDLVAERRSVAERLDRGFESVPGVTPHTSPSGRHVYQLYTVELPAGVDRDAVVARLGERNIASKVYWDPPVHRTEFYLREYGDPMVPLPVTESVASRVLTLPMFPGQTAAESARIVDAVDAALTEQRRVAEKMQDPTHLDVVVGRTTPLEAAMSTIDQSGLGLVVVVDDDGRLVGTATDGDVRRGILDGVSLDAPIETVMNDDPVAVRGSWDDYEITERFSPRRLDRARSAPGNLVVPVLDDDGVVTGVRYLSNRGRVLGPPRPANGSVKTVLVIGGAGYIGSVLCGQLLDRGYTVRVLDPLSFGTRGIEAYLDDDRFTLVEGDMCSIQTVMTAIEGVDAVVHLGGLVGDPASKLDPSRTLALNLHSVKLVADICKYHQINRFLFASTCSVYGKSPTGDLLTEEDDRNPVSLYARTKIESERELLAMNGNFAPTVLRMATVYGLSPRMRFDLVVNVLSAKAYTEGVVPIFGGDQYRPNVHVADAARAFVHCLEAPIETVDHEVFNVGSDAQNYRIEDLGHIVADAVPGARVEYHDDREDERSYRVGFSKIAETLGYETEHTIDGACREITAAFARGEFDDYTDDRYSNYKTAVKEAETELHAD